MIVLDTHVLVWWVNDDTDLSSAAKTAIQDQLDSENGLILISSITAWEIALLVQKGRLALSTQIDDWLATVSEIDSVRFVPVDNDMAVQSTQLPGVFHPDPADRMIVALARHVSAPVVTADTRIRSYPHVKSIW